MTRKRMEQLLARYEPRIRRKFRQVMQRVQDKWTTAQLEAALEGGTLSEVIDDVERAAATFAAQTEAITVLVAQEVAGQLAERFDKLVSYDGTNERAVTAMRANRLRMVQGLSEETREAMTDVLADMTGAGINPRQQAVAIRDSLGLTRQQAGWVRNYRRRLETLDSGALGGALRDARFDGVVETAITSKTPLSAKQVDRMVERYAARALKYRSEVVARTESLAAIHEGADEMYQQGIDGGTVDVTCIVCKWHAVGLPRSRHWHASMKGQLRRWGEAFVSGIGNLLLRPGDRNAPAEEVCQCICVKSTRIYSSPEAAAAALAKHDSATSPSAR